MKTYAHMKDKLICLFVLSLTYVTLMAAPSRLAQTFVWFIAITVRTPSVPNAPVAVGTFPTVWALAGTNVKC